MSQIGDGGDSAVKFQGMGYGNIGGNVNVIDAHSTQAGDFQHARNIDGQHVFLTAEGARAYDNLANAYQAKVHPDMVPNDGMFSWMPGAADEVENPALKNRTQHHTGSTED